ncbi:MAG: tryptophan-rich sensory protein [Lachnospiraceae bacterium]|nr:tryptophan-rich sensory protein [Lachnospiraceae bacterium]
MKIKNRSTLIIAILIPIAVGTLSALFSGRMSLYSQINKPSLSPPGFIFPIVWIILYILMGISSYLIYESHSPEKWKALKTYALQLFFNFWWSIIFFRFSLYLFAFLWLLAMIALIAIMIYQFYQIIPLSSYLQIPYLFWCLFAAYLNFMIYRLN